MTVVDPRWIKPLDEKLIGMAAEHRLVAVVEDNSRVGGVGDAVARLLRDGDVDVPVRTFGIPQAFLDHAKRAQILTDIGLTPQGLARDITAATARDSVLEPTDPDRAPARRGTAPGTPDPMIAGCGWGFRARFWEQWRAWRTHLLYAWRSSAPARRASTPPRPW